MDGIALERLLPAFEDPDLLNWLEAADAAALDRLSFGLVRMDDAGLAVAYNAHEQRLAGLAPERVLGRSFFGAVARCADVPAVAGRLAAPGPLDEYVDYLFTLRMRPTPVRLRLLKGAAPGAHAYLAIQRV